MGRHPTFDPKSAISFSVSVNGINPIKYLAIDPGKYNGVCGYDAKFGLQFMYVVSSNDLTLFLEMFKEVDTCIYEGYKLFPNKTSSQIYSDMETPRMIGRIQSWGARNDVTLIEQPSNIKKTGYAWIGKRPPSKSSNKNDPMDAHVHAVYWGVRNGKINARDLLNLGS